MLDIVTLSATLGIQNELDKCHKQTGVNAPLNSDTETVASSTLSVGEQAANVVESGLNVLESAAGAAAELTMPFYSMFESLEVETSASSSVAPAQAKKGQ